MLVFRHVLAATDFGPPSALAVEVAADLARRGGAALTLVHAFDLPALGYASFEYFPSSLVQQVQEAAQTTLDRAVAAARLAVPGARGLLRQGAPWRAVVDAATEERADLLVVGTHGRRGVAHAMLGSVAEKVARLAPLPVLVARAPVSLSRVVVGTDFSDDGRGAVELAARLAHAADAELTVVHALELPLFRPRDIEPLPEDLVPGLERAARGELDATLAAVRATGVRVAGELRGGVAWRAILDVAGEQGADLVVVGTHGRRGLAHALLGSVAERVARAARVSVLVAGRPRSAGSETEGG